MRLLHVALALTAGLGVTLTGLAEPTQAQQAPSGQTITIIVHIAPGGAVDSAARLMAEKLQERLGQPVVVENRPGAGGVIGVSAVTKAAPDGRTLLMMGSSTVTARWLQKNVPYDITKDIVPIAHIASAALALFAHPSVPANDVKGLIELGRKPDHGLTVSINGIGTPHHLANLLLKKQAKIDLPEVPYRGTGPGIPDFLTGRVPLMWATPVALVSQLQAGEIKTLGVASTKRLALLPDTPTIAENVLPGFQMETWLGLGAPAGTPPEITERYAKALKEIVALPDIKEHAAKLGMDMGYVDGKTFSKTIAEDYTRFGKLVQEAGIAPK